MPKHSYAKLFGGVPKVKTQLVEAITNARTNARLTCDDVDDLCGLKGLSTFPTCQELEDDPSRISSRAFSLASFGLDLKLDSVLKPLEEFSEQQIKEIAEDMKATKSHALSAMPSPSGGDSDLHNLSRERQVRVYVLLKVMEEIDTPSGTP